VLGVFSPAFPALSAEAKIGWVTFCDHGETHQARVPAKGGWIWRPTGRSWRNAEPVDAQKDEYDKKKLILTDQLRAAEKETETLDRQISDYRTKKFGQNGELFTKQNELMKPVQNKVFKVIQDIAVEDDYDYILDKSADVIIMYSKEKYDLTSKVLEQLLTFGK
jgi:outer membrane protein